MNTILKIGLSTCSKTIDETLFREYSFNGITHMEISVSAEEYNKLDFSEIKSFADKYNVELWSFHLPFSPFDEIDISNRSISSSTIEYYKELIKRVSDIGIKNFIVHPSGEPIVDAERAERMMYAKDSLNQLADFASNYQSVILCENLPRTCLGRNSDEILELISVNDKLKIVFDTNHLLDEDYSEFIRNTGKKIESVHISDYDFLNERHWLPGEGKIDWQVLYNKLLSVGYCGPWLYEIGFTCPKSIYRPRNLTCTDIVENAYEIFTNKPLTTISTPIQGLTGWK